MFYNLLIITKYSIFTVYLKNQQTLDFQWLKKYTINDIDLELGLMMNINGDNTSNSITTAHVIIFYIILCKKCYW